LEVAVRARGKRVAIVGVGPVDTGSRGEGIPALAACIAELAQDHELTVYSLLKPRSVAADRGLRLRYLPFRTPFLHLDLLILVLLILSDACRRKIDLLHAIAAFPAGWICVALAKILRIPCVVSLHGEEVANLPDVRFGDLRNRRKRRITAWVCRHATVLTALTRFHAAGLAEIGVAPATARLLPLGVDRARFPFAEKELAPPYLFLHVSYAHPVKDVRTLLETFKLISDKVEAHLVIIGENHANSSTETTMRQLKLSSSVELLGPMPNTGLHEFYSRAHFLLHTSRYESQAVVVNEAMASGVVVCATNVGLVHDLGEDYSVLAEVGDSRRLAERVLELLADPGRYGALRARAYEWATEHDVKWTAAEHSRIYEHAIGH
jgi:glycosyltransferase involved in cell wall biosynthesis